MFKSHKQTRVACESPDRTCRWLVTRILLVIAFLAVLAAHAASGRGAQLPSLWLDDNKPVASVLFTQEEILGRLAADLGLTDTQLSTVREAARAEAASLASLKQQSDQVVKRTDLDQAEKQADIAGMGFNDQVRTAVLQTRSQIEAALSSDQISRLPGWVDARMQEQRSLAVDAAIMASVSSPTEASAGPYRIYATQYFSNFGSESVDVAVPDKYAKFASLQTQPHAGYPYGANYTVNLGLGARTLTVPVKDCGPWNIDDNYWNATSGDRPRRLFGDLPTGMPESQAAYYNGYNGGLDQFGRTVTNPAGVDLSPKAGVQLGLGYLVSGWVTLSFNWEAATPPPPAYPIIGAIKAKYDSLGGAPGGPHNAEYSVPGGRAQDFDYGRIIWNSATGTTSWIYGSILLKYDSLGGTGGILGMPLWDEYAVTGGRGFSFAGGRIYWSAATNAHLIMGDILGKYDSLGGAAAVGMPTTDEENVGPARASYFTLGAIYWTAETGSHFICGAIRGKYDAMGGVAALGVPTSDEVAVAGGRVSNLQVGRIYWSPVNGAHHVVGAIMGKYDSLGGPAAIGLPVGDEVGVGATNRMSEFDRGRIYWNSTSGAVTVVGGIYAKYRDFGGHDALGLPLADESDVIARPGGRVSPFERGHIYWSAATGAHPVYGAVLLKYLALGGPATTGLPTWDETGVANGRGEPFEVGRIYWSPGTDAHQVLGAILSKYDQMGGPPVMGFPTTDEMNAAGHAGARTNEFERGSIFWSPDGGVFSVYGAIAGKFKALGGSATLGLPTSDEMSVAGVAGVRTNSFEYCRIYWSATYGANAVYGGILGSYLLAGGPGGSLGLPISDEYAVPGGRRSDFQHGSIIWDYSTGATQITSG